MKNILFTLLFVVSTSLAFSQDSKTITGTVVDADSEPLIGATVSNEDQSKGTVTDLEGRFEIEATVGETLIASYLGKKSKSFTVGEADQYDIVLDQDQGSLEEIVVTGYTDIRREFFTGSSNSVTQEEIDIAGAPDVSSMLEAKVAGVTVDNVSGTFGAAPRITIRGNSSINGTNKPLWVVDGMVIDEPIQLNTDDLTSGDPATAISSALSGINPDDIRSIEVLKDASATALYGARAMNGAVIITTKQPQAGSVRVNYGSDFTFRDRPYYSQFNRLTSQQEMDLYREIHAKGGLQINSLVNNANYGAVGKMYQKIFNHELDWGPNGGLNEQFLNRYENANTDWFDVLFTDAGFQENHTLSFSGGSETASFYASLGLFNDHGQTIADEAKRYTSLLKGDFKLFDNNLNLRVQLRGNFRQQKLPGTQSRRQNALTGQYERDFDINPYSYALNTSRSMTAYNEDGSLEFFQRNFAPFNIIHEVDHNYIDLTESDINGQINLDFALSPSIDFNSTLQGRVDDITREHTIHENSNGAEAYRANQTQAIANANPYLFTDPENPNLVPQVVVPRGGFLRTQQNDLLNYAIRNSFNINPYFENKRHQVNAIVGQEIKSTDYNYRTSDLVGVEFDRGQIAVTDPLYFQYIGENGNNYFDFDPDFDRFVGYFANASYVLDEKYVVNGTVRYDGSNLLGEARSARWLPSWNTSFAWNIDREQFMEDQTIFSNLKLRASYGLNGSITVPGVSSQPVIRAENAAYRPDPNDRVTQLFIEALENSDLTWEKMNEFNVGLEFGLFDNRIAGQMDYYTRDSKDLIGVVQNTGVGGQAFKAGNYASMSSSGFEFAINSVNVKTEDFTWTTNLNISFLEEEITDLRFDPRAYSLLRREGDALEGYERRSIWSIRFAGLDDLGIAEYLNENGESVKDLNIQTREDLETLLNYEGTTDPRTFGGFSTSFRYKNFTLSGDASFKFGHVVQIDPIFPNVRGFNDFTSYSKEFINRWNQRGDESIESVLPVIPNVRYIRDIGGNNTYDLYNFIGDQVAQADYIRLRTIALGYQLPQKLFANNKYLRGISLRAQGRNLFMIYAHDDLNGQDPEFFNAGGVALPVARMFSLSLNANF